MVTKNLVVFFLVVKLCQSTDLLYRTKYEYGTSKKMMAEVNRKRPLEFSNFKDFGSEALSSATVCAWGDNSTILLKKASSLTVLLATKSE